MGSKILEIVFMSRFAEEAHSEFSQTSEIELLAKIIKHLKPSTIFAKSSILEVWLGSE